MLLMENDRNSSFSLLHPELFDEEQLREILISRCVSRNLTACSKDELVELFRSIALPLPQREYGDSRRERILSKKQQKRRRISITSDDTSDNKRRRISISSNDTTSFAIPSSSSLKPEAEKRPDRVTEQAGTERLKPPPGQINFQRKVIRLSDSAKQRITNELDKIVIKNKQTKEKSNSAIAKESTEDTNVCISAPENGRKQEIVTKNNNVSTAAVKLKRNSLEPNAEQSSEDNEKKEEKPSQKKRQKIVISW